MKISIIIPTINEEENIPQLLELLKSSGGNAIKEIIVVDGGSKDKTMQLAAEHGATTLTSPERGRAAQMNFAASQATGDVLYFVHADSRPPTTFAEDIKKTIRDGFPIGCYRFKFDSKKFMLKVNSFFTRFDKIMFRGGDQTLFVTREVFQEFNGYDEHHKIMEEYDFIERVRQKYPFKIMDGDVLVSARKYDNNSYLKVNFANFVVFNMYRLGYPQEKMIKIYYRMLGQENYNFDLE